MRYSVVVILCLMMVSCTEKTPKPSIYKNNDTIEITTNVRDSTYQNVIIIDEDVSKKIEIPMH
jgi:hypothetical protein